MKRLLSLLVLCSLVFVACERESIIRPQRTINVGFEYGEYIIPDTSPELWSAISKSTWIEIISTPIATVAKELRFAVARNESKDIRKGRIILQNGQDGSCVEISIVQGAYVRDANGHQWVDLGLSVDWAVVNIGANTLVDYGDYFAWGEVSTKEAMMVVLHLMYRCSILLAICIMMPQRLIVVVLGECLHRQKWRS